MGLSLTIWDHLGLYGTISDYFGLSPEARARPYNFETFCVTHPDRHTDKCAGHRGARAPKKVFFFLMKILHIICYIVRTDVCPVLVVRIM